MVYSRKHSRIHTHLCNAVTLVWGSLRLAPISCMHVHLLKQIVGLTLAPEDSGSLAKLLPMHMFLHMRSHYN